MGIFDNIKNVKATRAAAYLGAGRYIMRIDRVKEDKTRPPACTPFVAIEMTVVKALAFEMNTAPAGAVANWQLVDMSQFKLGMPLESPPHAEGEQRSHLIMANNDMFLPNVKAFVRDVMAVLEQDIDAEDCQLLTSDGQPLAGLLVVSTGRTIITKREGKRFTKIQYSHCLTKAEFESLAGPGFPAPEGSVFIEEGVQRVVDAEAGTATATA